MHTQDKMGIIPTALEFSRAPDPTPRVAVGVCAFFSSLLASVVAQLILFPLLRLGLLRVYPNLLPRRTPGLQNELTGELLRELRSQDRVVLSTEAGGKLFVSCKANISPLCRLLLGRASVSLPRVPSDRMSATCRSTVVVSLVKSTRNFFLRWMPCQLPPGHILWLFKKRTGVRIVLLNTPPVSGR